MIVPAVSGLAGKLSESLSNSASPQTAGALAGNGETLAGGLGSGGPGASTALTGSGGIGGVGGVEGAGAAGAGAGGASSSFGSELSEAISSLEGSQVSANSAAQSLATGTAKDPESAVVTVEDAQMAMDLASQLRTKVTEAAQNLLQTQV